MGSARTSCHNILLIPPHITAIKGFFSLPARAILWNSQWKESVEAQYTLGEKEDSIANNANERVRLEQIKKARKEKQVKNLDVKNKIFVFYN